MYKIIRQYSILYYLTYLLRHTNPYAHSTGPTPVLYLYGTKSYGTKSSYFIIEGITTVITSNYIDTLKSLELLDKIHYVSHAQLMI